MTYYEALALVDAMTSGPDALLLRCSPRQLRGGEFAVVVVSMADDGGGEIPRKIEVTPDLLEALDVPAIPGHSWHELLYDAVGGADMAAERWDFLIGHIQPWLPRAMSFGHKYIRAGKLFLLDYGRYKYTIIREPVEGGQDV